MNYINLENVNIDFPIESGERFLRKALFNSLSTFKSTQKEKKKKFFRALSNVTLKICEGDRIGIVGRNGAGKTTLLKVLTGIYEPTSGNISRSGKVTSLLSLMGGSHPELTGYENIQNQLLIHGFSRKEIKSYIPEIISFSELGTFIDQPVSSYSAGMAMRLAFAVSTSFSPEILIMDEWISAGDISFIKKAKQRIDNIVKQSRIVIFGSHDLDLVSKVTNKVIFLHNGEIIDYGNPESVIKKYKKTHGL